MRHALACLSLSVIGIFATNAIAGEVVRHPLPGGSTFPIAAAIEVPAGKTTVYLSGKVPPVVDESADKNSKAAFGDTEKQTVGILTAIEAQLKGMGLGMGDVVKMQVFLVGDPDMFKDGFESVARGFVEQLVRIYA